MTELRLASDNNGKQETFGRLVKSLGLTAIATPTLFNENEIKSRLEAQALPTPYDYVRQNSAAKFGQQRFMEQRKGEPNDFALLVSDSIVVYTDQDGKPKVLNRDGMSDAQQKEAIDAINREHEIQFVGSVTFGRKDGHAAFTSLTYLRIPLNQDVQKQPSVTDLPALLDVSKGYEAGYLSVEPDGDKLNYIHKPKITGETTFATVRPFISGLTADVVRLADVTARMDNVTSEVLGDSIGDHLFNTLAFYHQIPRESDPNRIEASYRALLDDPVHFQEHGGNCTFHTLNLARKLQELGHDPTVLVFESTLPRYEKGHSAIKMTYDGTDFLLDPGLSIPFAIPITEVPVLPNQIGAKQVYIQTQANLQNIIILGEKEGFYQLRGRKEMSVQDFKQEAAAILAALHPLRSRAKVDFLNRHGIKVASTEYRLDTGKLAIKIRNQQILSTSLEELAAHPETFDVLGNDYPQHSTAMDYFRNLYQSLFVSLHHEQNFAL